MWFKMKLDNLHDNRQHAGWTESSYAFMQLCNKYDLQYIKRSFGRTQCQNAGGFLAQDAGISLYF